MRRTFMILGLLLLAQCQTAQLKPVQPEPIDWRKCPKQMTIPVPEGGWKDIKWIWKDDVVLTINNGHFCMNVLAQNSETNQRIAKLNARAYEEKRAPFSERVGYWLEGSGLTVVIGFIVFLILA